MIGMGCMYNPAILTWRIRFATELESSRESRIEELLLAGLDHYFSGQHELAISVWTRVLFLDRSHARARAYIERARGAIAERQREGEELLQTGAAAFQRGDAEDARRLLTSAVERGAQPDEALAMLDRIERLARRRRRRTPWPSLAPPRAARSPRRPHAVAARGAAFAPRRCSSCWPSAWPSGVLAMIAWSSGVLPVEPPARRRPAATVVSPEPAARAVGVGSLARARPRVVGERPSARRAGRARRHPSRRSAPSPRPTSCARGSSSSCSTPARAGFDTTVSARERPAVK